MEVMTLLIFKPWIMGVNRRSINSDSWGGGVGFVFRPGFVSWE